MATTIGKSRCGPCGQEKVAYKCEGCLQTFCINHLTDHHRELSLQFDELENRRNVFRQKLTQQTNVAQKQVLVQEINQWEIESINVIQKTAEEARRVLAKHTTENTSQIEDKFVQLTEQLKVARKENDFNELHINQFREKFKLLEEQLNVLSNISVRHQHSPFIDRITVAISSNHTIEEHLEQTASLTTNPT